MIKKKRWTINEIQKRFLFCVAFHFTHLKCMGCNDACLRYHSKNLIFKHRSESLLSICLNFDHPFSTEAKSRNSTTVEIISDSIYLLSWLKRFNDSKIVWPNILDVDKICSETFFPKQHTKWLIFRWEQFHRLDW